MTGILWGIIPHSVYVKTVTVKLKNAVKCLGEKPGFFTAEIAISSCTISNANSFRIKSICYCDQNVTARDGSRNFHGAFRRVLAAFERRNLQTSKRDKSLEEERLSRASHPV